MPPCVDAWLEDLGILRGQSRLPKIFTPGTHAQLFADGFESGSTAAWSATVP